MRKQLAMGAGIALALGAVALGCSSSSSNGGGIFIPSSVDLNNGNNAPMSAIATNNLAADGGGFSASNQNFVNLAMQVNVKPSRTDGVAVSHDGSAIVVFQTADQLDGHFRLFMSYFTGTTFTPPIEVTGQDRDEYANAGGQTPDITTNAILMIPLNTSGYQGLAGSTTGDAGAVRGNSGNWVIVWDATTFTTAPNQKLPTNPLSTTTPGVGAPSSLAIDIQIAAASNSSNLSSLLLDQRIAQNLQGAHRALFETVFLKSLANSPSAFSQALGTNSSVAGTSTAPSREYRYGFLVDATEINGVGTNGLLKRGAETGFDSSDIVNIESGNTNTAGSIVSPAESVQSYGFASDGLSGCATFSGSGQPFSQNQSGVNAGTNNAGGFATIDQPHALLGINSSFVGSLVANPVTGLPGSASYTVGEDVTFVRLYWTQIVASPDSGDASTAATPILNEGDVGLHAGNRLAAFQAGLDLRTLQFDAAPTELTLGALSTEGTQPLKAAQSPLPSFATYNQYLFMNFVDASIAQTATTLSPDNNGQDGNAAQFVQSNSAVREFNLVLVAFTATDSQGGTSTVTAPGTRISVVAAPAGVVTAANLKQDNLDNDSSAEGNNNTFDIETFGNQDQAWLVGGNCGCPIVGQDEGLDDTTVFFVEQHSSAAFTGDSNIDAELCAVVLTPTGTIQTPGTNPVVLSQHVGENSDSINVFSSTINQVGSPNQGQLINTPGQTPFTPALAGTALNSGILQDPVEGLDYAINRDGAYVVVTYRQWIGTSSGAFQKGLNAVVMQTFRVPNSNGSTGTTPLTTASPVPNVSERFAAGNTTAPSGETLQPTANNVAAAIRIDVPGTTGVAISGQPGSPAAAAPSGTTQLGTGVVNMSYIPINPITTTFFGGIARFPTATGVNFQETFPCGYHCSYQSDPTLVNIMWEQGDTSEDRVYVRQLKIVVSTTSSPTATTPNAAGNIDQTTNPVMGDAIFPLDGFDGNPSATPARSASYQFLPGDAANLNNFAVGDLGSTSGATAAGNGGGLLIVYAKTTDGTISDGNGYNRGVFAVTWNGTTLGTPVQIDQGSTFRENSLATVPAPSSFSGAPFFNTGSFSFSGPSTASGGYINDNVYANNGLGIQTVPAVTAATNNGGGAAAASLHTNLAGFQQVVANANIVTNPSLSPTESNIYFTQETGTDANSPVGLFTRTFNHSLQKQANNTVSFGDSFVPVAGTSDFTAPQRLDHMTGGNVTGVAIDHAGTEMGVLINQDGHIWLSASADALTQPYTNNGKGSADPFLVDNDTSASAQFFQQGKYDDSSCNNLHRTVVFFGKNDLSVTNPNAANGNATGGGSGGSGPFNTGGLYAFRLRLRIFN